MDLLFVLDQDASFAAEAVPNGHMCMIHQKLLLLLPAAKIRGVEFVRIDCDQPKAKHAHVTVSPTARSGCTPSSG